MSYGGSYAPATGGVGGYYAAATPPGRDFRSGLGGRRDLNDITLPQERFDNLPAFEKHFYVEHPDVTARSEKEVERFKQARGKKNTVT